jgi:hypothetical protein
MTCGSRKECSAERSGAAGTPSPHRPRLEVEDDTRAPRVSDCSRCARERAASWADRAKQARLS